MLKSLDWLERLPRFSVLKFNLYRTWLLLNRFVPEYNNCDVYFITGSKGKGTVAVTLAAILHCAGINTGLVTSPHLIKITERINYNGKDITELEMVGCLDEIQTGLPQLPERFGTWIYSEILLVAALLWFISKGARTVVLEAGLGGRLDPGNVFRRPMATCISTVSMEHQGILGSTLGEIGAEKAGVVKPGTPLITSADGDALQVINKRVRLFASPVLVYGKEFHWQQDNGDAELVLPGRHLRFRPGFETNADKVNKAMAACLATFHPLVGDKAILEGIRLARLPGRFEVYPGTPPFVLDVAHTPESIANLMDGLIRRFPDATIAYVAGFLEDKPVQAMLEQIVAVSEKVYYSPVQDSRSYDANAINVAGAVKAGSITEAITLAEFQADVVCVTGSFAAVREARILLSNRC